MLSADIQGSLNVLMPSRLAWVRANFLLFIHFSVLSCNVKSQEWRPSYKVSHLEFGLIRNVIENWSMWEYRKIYITEQK